MQTKLLFQWILIILFMALSPKSFGRTIILNINNANSDGSLYQRSENVSIGDKIRFTNNLPYPITPQNSSFINDGVGSIPVNIQPGGYFEIELMSASKTQFTFVHMLMAQNKYYNSRINLTFQAALGVDDTLNKAKVKTQVFPNPCTDVLNITSTENISGLELYDITGKILFTQKATDFKENNKGNIPMTSYLNGKYFLKIRNTDGSYSAINVIKK
ncbi:putative secreted protein (Por secretion system target) [Chryseobacterium sp. 52]|uniref:T9SS type A sorting domain-containing protein n=1 Tax=Chryseobacterium sp. 52 TaxID=2035213 RepID=UPI000C18B724|nr:T9SS type A sorting domain-containing protein [Chryseobacterium sp. 52]PIF47199.1 putative secreted protein (Por secretion system target) [Chryseobacterium sp. 52]